MMSIGDIIRTNREQQKISQEELAYGICSTSNLSRIENGIQIPGRATYEALMERLGADPHLFPSFRNDSEVEAFRLKHKIAKLIFAGDFKEAESLLDKLDSGQKLENVYMQYIQYVRTIIFARKGGDPREVSYRLKQIAGSSIKDLSPKSILKQVISIDDLNVLNSLAISYYNIGEHDKGIDILYALKEYIERKVVDDEGISPMYTIILYNLSKWIGLDSQYKEVIRLCDIGIPRCVDYGAYVCFAGLLLNKGYALVMLGKQDESRKYLQESYYINRARGELSECEIIKGFANEHGIVI